MRGRGGYIGTNVTPAAAGVNSAAIGVWTVREAESLKRAGTWPISPPGGVGSGLQLWLDAADASTLFNATTGGSSVAADGAVARWADKSRNGVHATQAADGSRPLRKTSQQNGKDALLFDGTDDFLRVPYNASGSSGITVFAVFRRVAASTVYAFSNYEYAPTDGRGLLVGGSTSKAVTASGRPDGTPVFRSTTSGDATTNYVVATARWNGSNLFSYSNGAGESSTPASGESFQSSDSIVIGAAYASDPALIQSFSSVGIGEIIVYNSALSSTDRSAVESYLMSKWGIS
jgi:hypothetical protein